MPHFGGESLTDESVVVKIASKWSVICGKRVAPIKSTFGVLSFLMVLLFSQQGYALYSLPFSMAAPFVAVDPLELSATDRQWLDAQGVLKVGIATQDYEPVDIASDRNQIGRAHV